MVKTKNKGAALFVPVILMTCLLLNCGPNNSEAATKLTRVRNKVDAIREHLVPGDTETPLLLQRAEQAIQDAEHFLTEESETKAEAVLDSVLFELDAYLNGNQLKNQVKSDVTANGTSASWRDGETYKPIDGPIKFVDASGFKTGARSSMVLRPNETTTFELLADSEIVLKNPTTILLTQGTLRVSRTAASGPLVFQIVDLTVNVPSEIDMELTSNPITRDHYLSCYLGSLTYGRGDETGSLGHNEALFMGHANQLEKVMLPPMPRLEAPLDHETVKTGENSSAKVTFRWYTQSFNVGYQIQISNENHFTIRLHDELPKEMAASVNLPAGKYFWRVRAFGESQTQVKVPGAYSKVMTLYVSAISLGNAPAPGDAAKQTGPMPKLDNLKFESIGTSVIVSGNTQKGYRVKVNGETAMVNEDGAFQAIIESRSGLQTIRVSVTNPENGAETIKEQQIKI